MDVKELERELALVTMDKYPFKNNPPLSRGIFCIYCKKTTEHGVVSVYRESKDLFSASPYLKWTYMLRGKDRGMGDSDIIPTGEIRWFCSVHCLAQMMHEEWEYILERITSL